MMKKTLTLLFLVSFIVGYSQNNKNPKFGSVSADDFLLKPDLLSSDPAAVVLSDVGSSEFVGNNNGDFTIVFKTHRRVLIRKKSAFDEASFKIRLYQGNTSTEELLEKVEAAAYNLVNGKVVATKLNKENVIREKYNRFYDTKKFTLPDVREGSIIEYTYILKSQFDTHLRDWNFQSEYPTLWSEYQVTIPPMYNYVIERKGNFRDYLAVDSSKKMFKVYSILAPGNLAFSSSTVYTFSGDATCYVWAMKDIPAYKNENFVANKIDNISSVKFQLHSIKYSEENSWQRVKPWIVTVEELYKDNRFGLILNKEELPWLNKVVETICDTLQDIDAAKKIYNFVREKFSCNDYDALLMSETPKKIYESKKGNIADINLMLTSLLQRKGLDAAPVFLSTRGNGVASEVWALLDQFDYVICQLKIDTTVYFLDATSKMGFGKLEPKCYNGSGRLIAKMPFLVNLASSALTEYKSTVVFAINGEKGKIEASCDDQFGAFESIQFRENWQQKDSIAYFKEIAKSYSNEVEISNTEIENLTNKDEPIKLKYDFSFTLGNEDLIYFSPFLMKAKKENIFKAGQRTLPAEMPFQTNESYVLDIEIPKGYIVEEMPKSVRAKLNDDEGFFEYIISNKEGHILLRSIYKLDKTTFSVEDYNSLREFYGMIIKKHAEQIVFKKISK